MVSLNILPSQSHPGASITIMFRVESIDLPSDLYIVNSLNFSQEPAKY